MPTPKEISDAMLRDDELSRNKGNSAEQIAARKRNAALFVQIHFPAEAADTRAARLATVDYTSPITYVNGRTVDTAQPKGGFLGLGRKPAYWCSAAIPPKKPEDPIYALQFFPVKS